MSRRFAVRAGVLLAGLGVAFLVAEIGLRVAQPIRARDLLPFTYRYDEVRRLESGDTYIRFDPHLGWTPAPATARRDDGILYRTNDAGLRAEREYALEPPPGVRRLAALGDSFTHCDEVAYADCWTAGLERAWPGTEVLNFGAPGYGHDQAWLRYERDGRGYRSCAVVMGYMVDSISRVVNRFRPFQSPDVGLPLSKPRYVLEGESVALLPNPATTPEQLTDPGWVEANLGPRDHWYFPGMFVAGPFDASYVVRVARTAAYRRAKGQGTTDERGQFAQLYRADREPLMVAGRVLDHFAREVRRDGATPVVIVFGRSKEVAALREGGGKPYAPILDWLARAGIATIDVTDALAREARRTGEDALTARNGHYNRRANAVVAATLARELPPLTAPTCG